jgi:hypothetical protein
VNGATKCCFKEFVKTKALRVFKRGLCPLLRNHIPPLLSKERGIKGVRLL